MVLQRIGLSGDAARCRAGSLGGGDLSPVAVVPWQITCQSRNLRIGNNSQDNHDGHLLWGGFPLERLRSHEGLSAIESLSQDP
ncbi:MAG: hypothetical protein ACFCBU_14440 [Cyanophyceae cyanobacterium]